MHAAYRRPAKRWHPDHNPGDAGAEARFKEIAAAYEVFSNREQRAQLDRERTEAAAARSDTFSRAHPERRRFQRSPLQL
ncbi:MAG: DnaJ domain-containing protein [Pseudomonadota bacterium]|nr:DnaJ domain-containing protein [Pseudomonadota bacterium]